MDDVEQAVEDQDVQRDQRSIAGQNGRNIARFPARPRRLHDGIISVQKDEKCLPDAGGFEEIEQARKIRRADQVE